MAGCSLTRLSQSDETGPSHPAGIISNVTTPAADLPSQRGETWNDTEAIDRHRAMTPSERVALAIQISRAALRFAHAERVTDD
jgi:hypothetical protein